MSESLVDKLFGAVKESLANAPAEIGAELKGMGAHGSHELAAALFNGSSFVMYPRGTREDHVIAEPDHGLEAVKAPEPEQSQGMGY